MKNTHKEEERHHAYDLVEYLASPKFDEKTRGEIYGHLNTYICGKAREDSKERLKKLRRWGLFGALSLFIVAGLSKCNATIKKDEEYFANPTNVAYRIERNGVDVGVYSPGRHHANQAYIIDVDSNKTADAIFDREGLAFYTSDYKRLRPNENYERTIEMSPEIRELATRHLNNGKDLSRAIYEAQYKIQLPN